MLFRPWTQTNTRKRDQHATRMKTNGRMVVEEVEERRRTRRGAGGGKVTEGKSEMGGEIEKKKKTLQGEK